LFTSYLIFGSYALVELVVSVIITCYLFHCRFIISWSYCYMLPISLLTNITWSHCYTLSLSWLIFLIWSHRYMFSFIVSCSYLVSWLHIIFLIVELLELKLWNSYHFEAMLIIIEYLSCWDFYIHCYYWYSCTRCDAALVYGCASIAMITQ